MYSGQWLGHSVGIPAGKVILDIDTVNGSSEGLDFLFSNDSAIPSAASEINLVDSEAHANFEQNIIPFDARIGRILTTDDLSSHFPEANFPKRAKFDVTRNSNLEISVKWESDVETFGQATLTKVVPKERSIIKAEDGVTRGRSSESAS